MSLIITCRQKESIKFANILVPMQGTTSEPGEDGFSIISIRKAVYFLIS
jgi:hypothetical protein